MESLIKIFKFKHFVLCKIFGIDEDSKKHNVLQYVGYAVMYVNVFFLVRLELMFSEPTADFMYLANISFMLYAFAWIMTWTIGYTPFLMVFNLFIGFGWIYIVLSKILIVPSWGALAVSNTAMYYLSWLLAMISAVTLYNLVSPFWRKHYND